jgi:hypothetical protein
MAAGFLSSSAMTSEFFSSSCGIADGFLCGMAAGMADGFLCKIADGLADGLSFGIAAASQELKKVLIKIYCIENCVY